MLFFNILLFYTLLISVLLKINFLNIHKEVVLGLMGLIAFLSFSYLTNTSFTEYIILNTLLIFFVWPLIVNIKSNAWFLKYLPLTLILAGMLYRRIVPTNNYLAFEFISLRMIWLTLEVNEKLIVKPSFFKYLAFVFYFPSIHTGPIFSFQTFSKNLQNTVLANSSLRENLFRLIWGAVKIVIIASSLHPLIPTNFLNTGLHISVLDGLTSLICYYIYIYFNFSGTLDIAIAASNIIGIQLPENFRNPFLSKNINEFWQRWHITLGEFLRYTVFYPLQKFISSRLPPFKVHAAAVSLAAVSLTMGLWHSFDKYYIIYGVLHGLALIIHYYFSFAMQKYFSNYYNNLKNNLFYQTSAWTLTHLYIAFTLIFFQTNEMTIKMFLTLF